MPAAAVTSVNLIAGAGDSPGAFTAYSANNALSSMVVNRLAFIIVLGARKARLRGQSLRCFVGFEAAEEALFPRGFAGLSQAAEAEHQVVVRLEVFGVDGQRIEEHVDRLGVAPLQEQNAALLIGDDAVARVLAADVGEAFERAVVVAAGLLHHGQEEFGAREVRRKRQRFLQIRARRFGLAFLNQRARDVDPAIGVRGLGFGNALEGVLRAFEIALEQHADAPIVPALAVLFARKGLPPRLTEGDGGARGRHGHDGEHGNFRGVGGVLAAVVGKTRGTGLRHGAEGKARVIIRELAVVEPGFERDGAGRVARDIDEVVDRIGRSWRDQVNVEHAARLPGIALVDRVAPFIDQVGAVEVRALIDRAAAVVGNPPAPGEDAAVGVARLEFEPHVEAVDGAGGEEVADLAGADHGIDADGRARLEGDARSIERRRDLPDLADDDRAALLGFLTDGESGGERGRIGGAALHLNRGGRLFHRRGGEEVHGDETGLEKCLGLGELRGIVIDSRNRGVRRGESVGVDFAVAIAGIARIAQRHVAIGAVGGFRRVVEGSRALAGNAARLPVVVLVEAAQPAVMIHGLIEVHFVAGGAVFGSLLAHEGLEEGAAVRLRVEVASSRNPLIHKADAFLTYLNPEPHRRTFLQPFMREQTSEYCSACHKVHLDEPVNHYRWLRGFNEYDNWQASGISGQGARSFYYPAKSSDCADCHMPLRDSRDPGNRNGKVHSHRFAAANTAVAAVNHDAAQLAETEAFLKSGFITVDLFAASPVEKAAAAVQMKRRAADTPALASTFAVGEEAEQSGPVVIREVGKVAAPLDAPGVAFQPGSTVRVDAVVRTRKIGHFFPAGTIDGFDVWLEFQARDANGRILAWSGRVADDGRGPVDKGAHFYRSYLIDERGNPINKRNAWQARSVLYVHLIPPGAADTVHYLVDIPRDAAGPITLEARLNYRKFTDYYTRFSFGAVPQPGPAGLAYDSREYTADPAKVPVLPIVTMAAARTTVALGEPRWQPLARKQDRERWNDWGIGMLLQGDLKGAEYAFERVTEAEPSYPDGWVNVARALIQEGETEAARPYLKKALALAPHLARAEFFLAMVQKACGDYNGALESLADVRRQYPRDRVVTNQQGRILFLERRYTEAVHVFFDTLSVDPQDLQAHYNLMLCFRGLGQTGEAAREERLFRRFKADEASQALTAQPRLASPEDNNERQPIHDHTTERLFSVVRSEGAGRVSSPGN